MLVHLNHFYLTVDPNTYADIAGSSFLKAHFAPFEQRRTVRKDSSYTGTYLYGRNTYFEFFDSSSENRRVGDSAIAFGVEEHGGNATLASLVPSPERTLITRGIDDRQIPWFDMLVSGGLRAAEARFSSWVMEYDASFLTSWHPVQGESGITRAAVLKRYAGVLKDTPSKPLLEDVTAITIALDPESTKAFTAQNAAFGKLDFDLKIIPATGKAFGIREVRFRVRAVPESRREFRFGGHSVLRFYAGHTAIWTF